ncbi:DUF6238 family protein [Streptomyces specialis]|uniref:DUF6238 family protein n=1 Tax=Streptomyces specialis TaxID=498367 RepID=UPI00073EF5A8|nr:DUF6238 family protein [Streptomyces specialis]
MPSTPSPTELGLMPFATAALDFHRVVTIPGGALVVPRAELDAVHAHLVSLLRLLDAHATRAARLAPVEGDHLRAARARVWQAADHTHAAYHVAPRPASSKASARSGLPEGPPELTICQRHQRAAHLMRRRTTPADLRASFTGLVRH